MDYIDIIQSLRVLVADASDRLKSFPRKAEEPNRFPMMPHLNYVNGIRMGSMLRVCPERDFDQITATLDTIATRLNELEAHIEAAFEEIEEDDGREDQ